MFDTLTERFSRTIENLRGRGRITEENVGETLREVRVALLELPRLSDPMPLDIFLKAAALYKTGRQRGFTIRSTADCIVAAVAIEHNATVWHKDRDFAAIARYSPLRVVSKYVV